MGVHTKETTQYFPSNSALSTLKNRLETSRTNLDHPMSTRGPSRERSDAMDSEQVETFMATSLHLRKRVRKRVLPIMKSAVSSGILDVAHSTSFMISKDIHPDITLCTQHSCAVEESDRHHFLEYDHNTIMEEANF